MARGTSLAGLANTIHWANARKNSQEFYHTMPYRRGKLTAMLLASWRQRVAGEHESCRYRDDTAGRAEARESLGLNIFFFKVFLYLKHIVIDIFFTKPISHVYLYV